jgi:hypothetical protein
MTAIDFGNFISYWSSMGGFGFIGVGVIDRFLGALRLSIAPCTINDPKTTTCTSWHLECD